MTQMKIHQYGENDSDLTMSLKRALAKFNLWRTRGVDRGVEIPGPKPKVPYGMNIQEMANRNPSPVMSDWTSCLMTSCLAWGAALSVVGALSTCSGKKDHQKGDSVPSTSEHFYTDWSKVERMAEEFEAKTKADADALNRSVRNTLDRAILTKCQPCVIIKEVVVEKPVSAVAVQEAVAVPVQPRKVDVPATGTSKIIITPHYINRDKTAN